MATEHAVIDKTQSLANSIYSDFVTFSFLAFCIWLSAGSRWWTFVTGILFLFFCYCKIAAIWKLRVKTFTTKKELKDWADTLDWTSDSKQQSQ